MTILETSRNVYITCKPYSIHEFICDLMVSKDDIKVADGGLGILLMANGLNLSLFANTNLSLPSFVPYARPPPGYG